MNKLKKQSRAKEAKLTWDMLLLAVNRARKLYKINSELSKKELNSRHDLHEDICLQCVGCLLVVAE